LNRFFDQYFYLTLTVAFILLLVLGFFFYFPLTVILGGWDNNSIRDFSLARKMAGPSTFIVAPIYYLVMIATRISPLHNRFTLDTTKAYKELEELVEIREKNRKKVNIEA
jgi:heme/copper-type cytochrome/quinol oxidase subunit 2